ncbi:MAG: NUDIX domain-containing protein [Candidatus Spechtbacterales bacterium]|nr:NUDIX domain-containing protein [Candidatus Spechtbacterales bacterium]
MEKENKEYPRGVEVVASALIVKDEKILLIKSHKWGDIYLLPGGHVEPGETVLEAAKREGEEEVGLQLEAKYCVNIGELINDPDFNRKAHLVYFHFVCEAIGGELKLDERELKEFVWFDKKEVLNAALPDTTRKTIENYLKGVKIDIPSKVF